jgi:type IV secretory pathway VirB6-like protein
VAKYTLSDGTNILSQFRYIDYTLYDDYSYYQEAGVLNSTDYLIFTGIYSLGGTNNSQLTFTNDDTGITTTCTITSISSSTIKLSYDYDSSTTATLELIKI